MHRPGSPEAHAALLNMRDASEVARRTEALLASVAARTHNRPPEKRPAMADAGQGPRYALYSVWVRGWGALIVTVRPEGPIMLSFQPRDSGQVKETRPATDDIAAAAIAGWVD